MRCAAVLFLACVLHAGDPRPPANASVTRSADARIEADIRARFAKSKINADRFTVRVQGGVATLEGRTDVIQHKGVATRLARSGGATAVNNRIQISDAARRKAAASLEKGRRRVQLQRAEPGAETQPTPRRR
jgi:osmotically-inducible protein OsmY